MKKQSIEILDFTNKSKSTSQEIEIPEISINEHELYLLDTAASKNVDLNQGKKGYTSIHNGDTTSYLEIPIDIDIYDKWNINGISFSFWFKFNNTATTSDNST